MFKLIAKDSTTTALNQEKSQFIKLMASNSGTNVSILLDGKEIIVPVDVFYKKMCEMFLDNRQNLLSKQ